MMGNMLVVRHEEAERQAEMREQEMLRRAIEESKRDAGVNDMDNMTYEELLQLEEANGGAVSKGLKKNQISAIPTKMWRNKDTFKCASDQCTICQE